MSGYWTSRRIAMLKAPIPSWAAGAGLWRDFRRSAAGVTDTHAQTINADDAAGAYSAFAANAVVRTNRGLQTSPTRTERVSDPTNINISYTIVDGTISLAQDTVDPTGAANKAWTLSDTDVTKPSRRQVNFPALDTETYVLSVFIERTSGTPPVYPAIEVGFASGGTAKNSRLVLNRATGDFTTNNSNASWRVDAHGQFWRVSAVATNNGTGNTLLFHALYPAYNGDGSNNPSNTVTGSSVFAWPNVQVGAFAGPPILSAATVNGNQQVITSIPAPTTEAGLAVINLRGSADTNVLWSRNDGTANEWIGLIRDGANLDFRVIDGGATVADLNLGTLPVGRFGFAYTVGAGYARAQIVSGATVAAAAPASFPTVTQWAAGDGYSAARNAYLNTEMLALAAGVTANDATFAAWLARAALAAA